MTNKFLTILSLLLLFALPLQAAEKGAIELKSTAEVEIAVKNDQGVVELKRVPAASTKVVPGDTVIFTNYYKNLGEKPAEGVVLGNPVPEHMVYITGSAEGQGARIEFSIDRGKRFGLPETLKVKEKNGEERLATAAEYTHIRWTLTGAIAKGEGGSVSFRAKVK